MSSAPGGKTMARGLRSRSSRPGRQSSVMVKAVSAPPKPNLSSSSMDDPEELRGGREPVYMRTLDSSIEENDMSKQKSKRGMVLAKTSVLPAVRTASLEVAKKAGLRAGGPNSLDQDAAMFVEAEVVEPRETQILDRPDEADYKWSQDDYNALQRNTDTWTFFAVFRTRLSLLDKKWSYPGGMTDEKKDERTKELARYLLNSVLNLGPTFIKLGQLSSTRSDLFPAAFVNELTTLQDRVPAFSAEKAKAIIEKDLGQPVTKLFKSFDDRPIAAASLGQVHRATLFTGEQVVVKVQRPGLKTLFDIDLNNMKILASQLDKQDEANDYTGIYEECSKVLYGEIDYIDEGRSADRFRRNFKDTPWVRVPQVYWEYSSPRVLTLEYMPGVKITDREGLKAAGILKHGFFHADPHPGNVAVDVSGGINNGSLIYYDFGMMGTIDGNVKGTLLEMFYGIYRKNADQVIKALVDLKVVRAKGDLITVKRAIRYFIDNLARQTERNETIAAIGEDLFSIAIDQPFRFPATFTFVLRAFSTLEGIGKTLDPEYKFSEVARPYAVDLLDLEVDQAAQRTMLISQVGQQASELATASAAMPFRIQRIDSVLEALEAGDLQLRVRVLQAERSDRRAGVLQGATMNAIGCIGFLNMGTMLALQPAAAVSGPMQGAATMTLGLAAVYAFMVFNSFKTVSKLDKFEKDLKG
eukprot:gene18776-25315_t